MQYVIRLSVRYYGSISQNPGRAGVQPEEEPVGPIRAFGGRGIKEGVDKAMTNIAESIGEPWYSLRDRMREEGCYHVETDYAPCSRVRPLLLWSPKDLGGAARAGRQSPLDAPCNG